MQAGGSPPTPVELDARTYKLVAEAHEALGRLDAGVRRLPAPAAGVRAAFRREARSSSALAGIDAPLTDVLAADYVEAARRSPNVQQVMEHVDAAQRGLDLLGGESIGPELIADVDRVLGGAGAQDGLDDWAAWFGAEVDLPLLVRCAIGLSRFESRSDGSDARLGRLLVLLQLVQERALAHPILAISPWFEQHRVTYEAVLADASASGRYDAWVQLFSEAVRAQAVEAGKRIGELLAVRDALLDRIRADKARGVILDLVEDLMGYPYLTPSEAAKLHGVTYPPANAALRRLEKLGLVREATGGTYGRVYVCPRVLAVLERP